MKKEDIFEALGDIDADVVLSAAPKMRARKKNTFVLRLAAVAACVALLVSAVVVSTLLLNREDKDITRYNRGGFDELEAYIKTI